MIDVWVKSYASTDRSQPFICYAPSGIIFFKVSTIKPSVVNCQIKFLSQGTVDPANGKHGLKVVVASISGICRFIVDYGE